MVKKIRSILIANRSEIAIRVMRASNELGIRTVGIYANEDRFALHRFKADESYLVGEGKKPISAYLDIEDILRIAKKANVDAIHPGYGFLSENPDFAEACRKNDIIFIGPDPSVMRTLGNKVDARNAAVAAGVSVMPATKPLPQDFNEAKKLALAVGYPLMLKASWGGGGRGMRVIEDEKSLEAELPIARREALAAFGNDEVYLEKLVRNARHVEVQIIGDKHGNVVHLFERDCSVQRRNQKVVERAPAPYLNEVQRKSLCDSAIRLMQAVHYTHAGTVEFLMDGDSGEFYFIEVNPRIQVEHTVTEQVTGIDIVKAQIHISEGAKIGTPESGIPSQENIKLNGHALQCRVTTEDPENGFSPDYGKISTYRSAAGFGIRLDAGTAYAGAVITPFYDSLLVKVTASAPTSKEAIARMDRALREFRVRGLSTNLQFLENVINHPLFISGECSTRFIDNTPELYKFPKRRDRATRLLNFISGVIVNGNPEVAGRTLPALPLSKPLIPKIDPNQVLDVGTKDRLTAMGPKKFSEWMRNEKRILLTDTTMRDAHQSLFATRMRTDDMVKIAPYYAQNLSQLFSLECWGGATFDVSMRFLNEDPWDRLKKIRSAAPNILLQMLLRSSNAVGYTNYPDNVVRYFIEQAAQNGIDLFRVFDSLNWVENMRVSMDAVLENNALCEATICYTGDIFNPNRAKYNLNYYVNMAKQLEKAGAHIIGIKDMAGVCRPLAITALVKAIKEEVGLPVHFHTHDTSGASIASVLAAIEAGVDAVDGAMDAMSGLTSQPSLGGIIASTEGTSRDSGIALNQIRPVSAYWEGVRKFYSPFEADIRSGTSDVYLHEMPGGQYTNLREQARSLGIDQRWSEVAQAYADVNQLFGDIVKVTPSSKVVGDMALYMVTNDLTPEQVLDPAKEINFPESVISLFRGEMGYPADGFPKELGKKILKDKVAIDGRAGAHLESTDLVKTKKQAEEKINRHISDTELASYLMYPKVFTTYADHHKHNGDVSLLPTPVFFYGLNSGEEMAIEIDPGKTLVIRLQGTTPVDEEGVVRVFFELNGQPRTVKVKKLGATATKVGRIKAEIDNPKHIAAPLPGMISTIAVKEGQKIQKGNPLVSIEAMKMETMITANEDGVIKKIHVSSGNQVDAKDLLIEFI
ncbi:pyruvate carboxylase [Polynucleobacter sp. 30F-ANTBAC]|uniref:pyruvate carboxylase n=1 Tax=Polynucleobacter sp. 30F-ANTBAC TaxID=2689095 RepID=UPI001C0D5D66